jgi:hypothetical protein
MSGVPRGLRALDDEFHVNHGEYCQAASALIVALT